MRSLRLTYTLVEIVTLAIMALFFLVLFSLLEKAIVTYFIGDQAAVLRQIDVLIGHNIDYNKDDFTNYLNTADKESAKKFLHEFSDLYFVGRDKRVARIYFSEEGSFIFPGFDAGSSVLGSFLETVKSPGTAVSPMTRSPEKDDLGIYLAEKEPAGWFVGRIGMARLKANIKDIARSMNNVIIIASKDGYILSSSAATLPFSVLPDITEGKLAVDGRPYAYSRMRCTVLDNDIVILSPMDKAYDLVRTLRLLALAVMGLVMIIVIIKIVWQSMLIIRPLSTFSGVIARWGVDGGVIPAHKGFMRYREIADVYRTFENKAAVITDSFDVIRRNQEALHESGENLKSSLDEKETLLKELYHRTKNNMQIISSILGLQASYLDDEKITKAFRDTANRINSISLVHQKLYQSQSLSRIDLKDYIEELVYLLISSYGFHSGKATPAFDMESVPINIDIAVPCGLVLNELITNSLKYAFPDGRKGVISVSLKYGSDKILLLEYGDDGVGLPEATDLRKSKTLGASIIVNIVENQLKGTVEFINDGGFRCRISFNPGLYAERL